MNERDRILANTSRLFMKRGVRALTMDEIALENGVSKRTLYELFKDKGDLLEACLMRGDEEHKCSVAKLEEESDNVLEFLVKMYEMQSDWLASSGMDFFNDIRRYYPHIYKRTVECSRDKRFEHVYRMLEMGQNQGVFERNIKRDLVARILSEILIESNFVEMMSGYEHSKKEVLWSTIVLYIRGITTDKGRVIIDNFFKEQNKK